MKRPDYTPCRLYYDGGRVVLVGQFLRTPGGSAYLVQKVTQSPTRELRRYLECVRWPAAEIPADATVHPLHWYPRARRPARRLSSFASAP